MLASRKKRMKWIGRLEGRAARVAYGIGNMGSVLTHVIGGYLIFFYVDEVGLDPSLVGLGFSISYGVWNAVNDPIAGYLSDRTRTRWGRRIPYIAFFTPLMMALFVLLWTPPAAGGGSGATTFLYFSAVLGAYELAATFVNIGWNSLFPEMFQTPEERTEVSAYRQVASLMGAVAAFALAPLMVGYFSSFLGAMGWAAMAATMASLAGAAYATSLLGSRERSGLGGGGTLPLLEAFRITLANRSFLSAAFSILMISWIWSILSAMTPFIVVYMLGRPLREAALISAPPIFIAILLYPLWRRIAIRHGAKRTLAVATALSVIALLALLLAADDMWEALVAVAFFGAAHSGVTLTRELLIPDVIDEDELRTGLRREGVYWGVTTFIDRFSLALTGASTSLIFWLSGFAPGAPQAPEVVWRMRLATAAVLAAALAGFGASIASYPIGLERSAEIRAALEKIRGKRARTGG